MDPHHIEQNIQALNDGEHNLKLHAPCSIIRCLPCLVQCIGTAIQGSFWGDSTGCDVMGFYSDFATYSSQLATLLIAYLTYLIVFSTVPKWEYVALVGLAIFVLSGLISMLPLIGVASYVKYDGFCYIDYRDVTHCVLWLLIIIPCVFGVLLLYVQIYKRSGLSKTVRFGLLGFWPRLHPQVSKAPPQRPETRLTPIKPPGTAQSGRAQPGPTIHRPRRARPRQPIQPNPPRTRGTPPSHRPPSATPTSSEQPSKTGPRPPPWAGTAYKRTGPSSPSKPSGT